MPTVPIEKNSTGIAGATDAKLKAADLSDTGLQAIGDGLQRMGTAGAAFAEKSGTLRTPNTAVKANQSVVTEGGGPEALTHEAEHLQAARNDADSKGAWNTYADASRALLRTGESAFFNLAGAAAQQALKPTMRALADVGKEILDRLPAGVPREMFQRSIAVRMHEERHAMQAHADRQIWVEQDHQARILQAGSVNDALDHADDPPSFWKFVATGVESIVAQADLHGLDPITTRQAADSYRSNIFLQRGDLLIGRDPLEAATWYGQFHQEMTPEDRQAAVSSLQAPLVEAQAKADIDSYDLARAQMEPATMPTSDPAALITRMRVITPMPASGDDGLEAALQRYNGSATKAWTALRIGDSAVDDAVKRNGDHWFGAIPADVRAAVAGNVALLGSAASPRLAPASEERAAISGWIDAQPWEEDRKRAAHNELDDRVRLDDQRLQQVARQATDTAFAVTDQMGSKFVSPDQVLPELWRTLPDEAKTALALRARQNSQPMRIPPNTDVALGLNMMAVGDPDSFLQQDLRLLRDRVTPAEYAWLQRMQKGLASYPPSVDAVTQQHIWDAIRTHAGDLLGERDTGGSVAMRVFGRMQTQLDMVTGGKRLATDAEIADVLKRALSSRTRPTGDRVPQEPSRTLPTQRGATRKGPVGRPPLGGRKAAPGSKLRYLLVDDHRSASGIPELDAWEAHYREVVALNGRFSNSDEIEANFAADRKALIAGEAKADAEIKKFLFAGVVLPTLGAASAVLAPVAGVAAFESGAGYLGSAAIRYLVGSGFGVASEYAKNRAFGLEDSVGGYAGAAFTGGLGTGGWSRLDGISSPALRHLAKFGTGAFTSATGDILAHTIDQARGSDQPYDFKTMIWNAGINGFFSIFPDTPVPRGSRRQAWITRARTQRTRFQRGTSARVNAGVVNRAGAVEVTTGFPKAAGAAFIQGGVQAELKKQTDRED